MLYTVALPGGTFQRYVLASTEQTLFPLLEAPAVAIGRIDLELPCRPHKHPSSTQRKTAIRRTAPCACTLGLPHKYPWSTNRLPKVPNSSAALGLPCRPYKCSHSAIRACPWGHIAQTHRYSCDRGCHVVLQHKPTILHIINYRSNSTSRTNWTSTVDRSSPINAAEQLAAIQQSAA